MSSTPRNSCQSQEDRHNPEEDPPKTLKELQPLVGYVAALCRYISQSAKHCLPFFEALKRFSKTVIWIDECQKAVQEEVSLVSPHVDNTQARGCLMVIPGCSGEYNECSRRFQLPTYYASKRLASHRRDQLPSVR